jgi:hypothetical protein
VSALGKRLCEDWLRLINAAVVAVMAVHWTTALARNPGQYLLLRRKWISRDPYQDQQRRPPWRRRSDSLRIA